MERCLASFTPHVIDDEALRFWAAGIDDPDPNRTLFRGVRRLLPNHVLAPNGNASVLPVSPRHTEWIRDNPERLAAELRRLLFRAIERSTSGASTVAVLLGGVDSSAVLSILTRLRSAATIKAITIDFPGTDPDRPYAEALCKELGVELTVIEPDAWAPLSQVVLLDDSPYPMVYGGAELAAYRAAADAGADVVVTAVMGDSIFGGHLTKLGLDLFWREPVMATRLALEAKIPDVSGVRSRLRKFIVAPNVREHMPPSARAWRARRHWRRSMPWATRSFLGSLERGATSSAQRYATPRTPTDAYREWATSPELAGLVEVSHLLASHHGIEWREAVADEDLIDFMCAIPIESLLDGRHFRGLLRRALVNILPEPTLSRATKAELRADMSVLRGDGDHALVRSLASGEALARRGFVDATRFRRAVEHTENLFWIWRFLAAEAFLRKFT